jgi:hypothetical protein
VCARAAAQHRFDLELLVRLAENLQRGSSNDTQERLRMGADARALIGALGPERLPMSLKKYGAESVDELRAMVDDNSREAWHRCALEAVWELHRTAAAHRY